MHRAKCTYAKLVADRRYPLKRTLIVALPIKIYQLTVAIIIFYHSIKMSAITHNPHSQECIILQNKVFVSHKNG